jgi:diguanylate cyclase (GGDEF)-like protein
MDDAEHPLLMILGWIDVGRKLLGYSVVLAIGIAFVAIGNTPERYIGAALVVLWLALGFREAWNQVRRSRPVLRQWYLRRVLRLDPLTRLGSHRRVQPDLARALRHGSVAVLVLAVNLKGIWENYGLLAGDMVIAEIASILRTETEEGGKPYRAAGNEFALILPASDRRNAEATATRVRDAVAQAQVNAPRLELHFADFTVRFGIATGSRTRRHHRARAAARQLLVAARAEADTHEVGPSA